MDGVIANLNERWDQLTDDLNEGVRSKWWTTIKSKYTEPNRKYHNVLHLYKMFEHLDCYKESLASPEAVAFAVFFHDLEYDPKAGDNEEKSVELFEQFSTEAGISEKVDLVTNVTELIHLTKTHSTDEHKNVDVFGSEDKHFFLDFDVSILGSNDQDYDLYANHIREEYDFLPRATYNSLRSKVLKSFLQIPNIFATQEFREKYENQAKRNIEREIQSLESNI